MHGNGSHAVRYRPARLPSGAVDAGIGMGRIWIVVLRSGLAPASLATAARRELGNLHRRLLSLLQVAAGIAEPVLDPDGKPVLAPVLRGGRPVLVDGKPQMRVKMQAKYSWHALALRWLASRIDLKTVQDRAGHATLALTIDRHGHLIPRVDDHARIAAAEAALLGSARS
jgi:hypothetical protein